MKFKKHYILDTNIILEDASNIFTLSQECENLIILPETVLDEIDNKKSGYDEINFQARQFARLLENSKIISSEKYGTYKIVRIKLEEEQKAIIDIISKENYESNIKNISSNIINDRKILEIAKFSLEHYNKEAKFLSLDIMARIRAISLDIKTDSLLGSKEDKFDYEFIKDITINFEDLENLDNQEISIYDKDYKPYNYNYCFKVKSSDQVILANIENGKIQLLDENEVRNQIIAPLNKEQLFFSNALQSYFYNVLIIEAKAGSGKTLLALSSAVKLIKQKQYQKVVYIRNSIESLDKGEDIGYLPGFEEKFAIYNHPLMDSLDYIVRTAYKKKQSNKSREYSPTLDDDEIKTRVDNMIKDYHIETMWIGEMRGRTISNAFIIIDEAQNMSNKTMQMVLSRIDNSCKVVILGSNNQIDNFYVNKHTNALTTILKSTQENSDLVNTYAIKLEKVLRGPITEWAENIFSK